MTNIPTLREVLAHVESLKGPLTRGEAEKVADKLFIREHERESWLDVVAALGGGRSALGAVVALIEREMPEAIWATGSLADRNYSATLLPTGDALERRCEGRHLANSALALLAAYLRARIAEAELAGQRAGKAS